MITDWQRLQVRPWRTASPAPARWAEVSWSLVIFRGLPLRQDRRAMGQEHTSEGQQVIDIRDQPGGPVTKRGRVAPLAPGWVPDL